MTAGSLQTRHLLPTAVIVNPVVQWPGASLEPSGYHRSNFDVVVIFQAGVSRDKCPITDDQVGFAVQLQIVE